MVAGLVAPYDPGIAVLFLCTGNQCRSPMAAALLRAQLDKRGSDIRVDSAGFVSEGLPPPREVLDVMEAIGLDLAEGRSKLLSSRLVGESDLIVGMTRQHVVDVAATMPVAWERSFTFTNLLQRGEVVGPRQEEQAMGDWVALVHAGRLRSSLLALPLADDIPDPIGGPVRGYERVRDRLVAMTSRLADLLVSA